MTNLTDLFSGGSFIAPAALNAPIHTEPGKNEEVIYFAAGCFWGVDKVFWNTPGVVATATGYMGGTLENPSYEDVCSGLTGHAETVRVVYSTEKTSVAQLISLFFEIHDPTQVNRQGNDRGSPVSRCNLDFDGWTVGNGSCCPGCVSRKDQRSWLRPNRN